MTTAARSTSFLTTETHKKLLNERYEKRNVIFHKIPQRILFFSLFFVMETVGLKSHGTKALKAKFFASKWAPSPRVTISLSRFNFGLPNSDATKLYIIPKCFRDTDRTAKSVSSNSSSKNSDTAIYANSGKLKILKISNLISNAS